MESNRLWLYGPLGALPVLAEMVGPDGCVLGVDFSESAVQKARSVASALRLTNVEVVAGDINELDPAALGGPFDLAYTRLFLMHQANPVQTLRQIAKLLRPVAGSLRRSRCAPRPHVRTPRWRRSVATGSCCISS